MLNQPCKESHWIRLVTRADHQVARQLVEGLVCDLVAPDDGYYAVAPELPRTSFDVAAQQALDEEFGATLSLRARAWEAAAARLAPRSRVGRIEASQAGPDPAVTSP